MGFLRLGLCLHNAFALIEIDELVNIWQLDMLFCSDLVFCFSYRLLFRAAYYFSNGPFLRFWIRKGYDPRKDPESRM